MRMTIGTKMVVGFGAMLALIMVVGAIGWRSTVALSGKSDDLFRAAVRHSVNLAHAEDAVWRLRYGFPQFMVLGPEDRRRIVDEEPKHYAVVNENMKAYEAEATTPEERAALKEWREVWEKYVGARPKWFELYGAGKLREAAEWRAATTTPYGAAAVKALDKLIELQRTVAVNRNAQAVSEARNAATLSLVIAVAIALAIGGGFAVVIARSITRPLSEAVSGQTTRVLATSQEMAGAAEQLSRGAQEQASSLEETAASLEEMTSTGKQNTDNARQASRLALDACAVAGRGGEAVASAVSAMSDIRTASKRIADILSTIDEIAFQTNLLALNAAVEAARAGEQGRGFAVVATEVRTLAQRSAAAAKEIKALIQDSNDKVAAGSDLVNQSGRILDEIVTSTKKVAELMGDIAAAVQEQSLGVDQISQAVMRMDQVTQNNASQAEELAAAAQTVTTYVTQLQTIVGQGGDATGTPAVVSRPTTTITASSSSAPAWRPTTTTTERRAPARESLVPVHAGNGRRGDHDGFEEF
jgi:methyl-accepting chemotaxis protein